MCLESKLLASASDLSSDLSSEVVDLLLDALTLNVVNSVDKGDLATQLLGSIGNVASHVTLEQVGTDELLLQQADLLVEGGDLTGSETPGDEDGA